MPPPLLPERVRQLASMVETIERAPDAAVLAEAAFQNGSAFVLGGVLEAFFRRHVALNSFVETVVRTSERGEVMRWPSHIGSRHLA